MDGLVYPTAKHFMMAGQAAKFSRHHPLRQFLLGFALMEVRHRLNAGLTRADA